MFILAFEALSVQLLCVLEHWNFLLRRFSFRIHMSFFLFLLRVFPVFSFTAFIFDLVPIIVLLVLIPFLPSYSSPWVLATKCVVPAIKVYLAIWGNTRLWYLAATKHRETEPMTRKKGRECTVSIPRKVLSLTDFSSCVVHQRQLSVDEEENRPMSLIPFWLCSKLSNRLCFFRLKIQHSTPVRPLFTARKLTCKVAAPVSAPAAIFRQVVERDMLGLSIRTALCSVCREQIRHSRMRKRWVFANCSAFN